MFRSQISIGRRLKSSFIRRLDQVTLGVEGKVLKRILKALSKEVGRDERELEGEGVGRSDILLTDQRVLLIKFPRMINVMNIASVSAQVALSWKGFSPNFASNIKRIYAN